MGKLVCGILSTTVWSSFLPFHEQSSELRLIAYQPPLSRWAFPTLKTAKPTTTALL